MLPRLRILQIGDVHLPGAARSPRSVDAKDKRFPADLRNMIATPPTKRVFQAIYKVLETEAVAALLFMGDLTDIGKLPGYEACARYIRNALQLGAGEQYEGLLTGVVPGNHDINRELAKLPGAATKFEPLQKALKDAGLKPLPVTKPIWMDAREGQAAAKIGLLNSCWGCGEREYSQMTGLRQIDLVRDYDMALAAISWEQRATAAFGAATNRPKAATLIRFASTDAILNQRKDAAEAALSGLFAEVELLKLDQSIQFSENAQRIEAFFRDKFENLGRPLRILLDVTCMPKSYLLFLIGMGFTRDFFCRIDCMYAEGDYTLRASAPDPASGNVGLVSEGEWGALQIPYLGADSAFPAHRDLIVAMGGEIGLSIPFIERYEPRRLGLILIGESLAQTPEKLPPTEAAALKQILEEGNVDRVDIPLADVVGMVDHTSAFCRNASSEAVSGIALSSKPHALALGVAALSCDNLEIICRVPKRYRPLDVAPAGPLAFYEIEDRFEPSAYLS